MEQITFWQRLKKHYILVLAGLLSFLLLITFGVYRVLHSRRTTPIAWISPKDSLETAILPPKLEMYRKELMEQEKQAYQRKAALEEIISMDFSQRAKAAQGQKPKQKVESAQPPENILKTKELSGADLPETVSRNRPARSQSHRKQSPAGAKKAADGFYTIKAGNQAERAGAEKADEHIFVKALIHGDQKIKGGGTVCLRLLEQATFGGSVYPKNTILYGRINGGMNGRVQIAISQVKASKVHLSVYDQDYREGIAYQKREAVSEISRESRDDALEEVFSSLPYGGVAGGLAGLGRNVMRRTKQVNTIYLSDGYEVFIAQAD
jgi:hypothetical protein